MSDKPTELKITFLAGIKLGISISVGFACVKLIVLGASSIVILLLGGTLDEIMKLF